MGKRQPCIVYEWRPDLSGAMRVYWSLVGGNGEIQCQSSQGSRDMTDARRAVNETVANITSACPVSGVRHERVAAKRPPSLAAYSKRASARMAKFVEAQTVKPAAAMTDGERQQTNGNAV